jgi:hypothetical protein
MGAVDPAPTIKELQAAGCESLRANAAGLEERGIPAAFLRRVAACGHYWRRPAALLTAQTAPAHETDVTVALTKMVGTWAASMRTNPGQLGKVRQRFVSSPRLCNAPDAPVLHKQTSAAEMTGPNAPISSA